MRIAVLLALLTLAPLCARAQDDGRQPVPAPIQGRWAPAGHCGDAAKVVTFTAGQVIAGGRRNDVYYTPDASPRGFGAVFFAEEGEVSNYEFDSDRGKIILNEQGFGMGHASLLDRCPAAATQNRCGWLANLTPGDWRLVDRDGSWTIAAQGSRATAAGMDKLPAFDPKHFVRTQGDYGYGCACLHLVTGLNRTVREIASARLLPLATCKADRSLPAVDRW